VSDGQALFDLLDKYRSKWGRQTAELRIESKESCANFTSRGKRKGISMESIPFELLYLYSEIFDAGV